MTDQECENFFQQIIELLSHSQFSRLIDRIKEQVAEGKIVENEVKTFTENLNTIQDMLPLARMDHANMKPSSKALFATIVPYTAQERLEILIDILEQALITPIEIQAYLSQVFTKSFSFQGIVFVSPEGETVEKINRDDQNILTHQLSAKKLREVLTQLRKEL